MTRMLKPLRALALAALARIPLASQDELVAKAGLDTLTAK